MPRMSRLQKNPKSEILKPGYINIYSELNAKEIRQHKFKTLYKNQHPEWDETQVFLSKHFANYLKPDLTVLDAGCGNGNYIIDEHRGEISWAVGVDLDEEFVGKNICLDEIIIADLENLPFDTESFDAVISLWVLEHVKNPKEAFSEINRVLKPGGVFIFAAPNKDFAPLIAIRLIKFEWLNHLINRILFGRRFEDVFKTYYRSSTVEDLTKLAEGKFDIEVLTYNYDPGYTAFNNFSYNAFNFMHKLFSGFGLFFTFPHIVGVLKKTPKSR